MDWRKHNELSSRRTRDIEELKQAYWHAYTRATSKGMKDMRRRKWRQLADRARESLVRLGVHV